MKTRFVRPSDEKMINVFDKEFSNEKVSKFSLNSKVKTLILTGIRYATPECGSCQRSKLSDEECLVMTRGKIVSISQEEVNLFPTFKLNTIEQFSMLGLELSNYSSVPNRRAVRNKHAGGKILKKTLNMQDRINVLGGKFS